MLNPLLKKNTWTEQDIEIIVRFLREGRQGLVVFADFCDDPDCKDVKCFSTKTKGDFNSNEEAFCMAENLVKYINNNLIPEDKLTKGINLN